MKTKSMWHSKLLWLVTESVPEVSFDVTLRAEAGNATASECARQAHVTVLVLGDAYVARVLGDKGGMFSAIFPKGCSEQTLPGGECNEPPLSVS
jgi:hypothetical protein